MGFWSIFFIILIFASLLVGAVMTIGAKYFVSARYSESVAHRRVLRIKLIGYCLMMLALLFAIIRGFII